MANLKEIKNRIGSVSSTQQITKAMKLVSAAKLRKAQHATLSMRAFYEKLAALTHRVCQDKAHACLHGIAQETPVLYLLISSDRGLCGAFNSNVFKKMWQRVQDSPSPDSAHVMPLGKRGSTLVVRQFPSHRVVDAHGDIFSALSYERVSQVADYVRHAYETKAFSRVEVLYNAFKSMGTQQVCAETLLPISFASLTGDVPARPHDYVYESGVADTVEMLVPYFLRNRLFLCFLESQAAEHAARMAAMEKATENTEELLRELNISYNRTRQTAITTEILEIIAGAEALKS